uniref:Dehydrogenase/reductase (SDR family) member 13b.1 n=1 Tax=Echeneis naucrates TaxID=173247 RepID=A0A665VDB2_ECHNA
MQLIQPVYIFKHVVPDILSVGHMTDVRTSYFFWKVKVKVSLQLDDSSVGDFYEYIIMCLLLNILLCLYLCTGVLCADQLLGLPCEFIDEKLYMDKNMDPQVKFILRQAHLQFGQKGDSPLNPKVATFLITGGSRLDLQRYLEKADAEQLDCEVRRYRTQGIGVRWPVHGAEEYNQWFNCTLKQRDGLFTVTSILRQPSDKPPSAKQGHLSWPAIQDREILITSVAMVIKTQTPSVTSGLRVQQKLHCQFAVDHKSRNVTVEWIFQHRGERNKLFSHNSHTGQTQGSGVGTRGLAGGDASYNIPFTKMSSEGIYTCSVMVMPLFISLDLNLNIQETPRVSINIGPTLVLQEGNDQKVTCDAENYYPLDVEIKWYVQDPMSSSQRVGAPLPKELQNILLSSHKHNNDKTFSLSAFFYLEAQLKDSGRQFTCSVSHRSLRLPIKKSFILTVEEPSSWLFNFFFGGIVVVLLVVLCVMLKYLNSMRKKSVQKKPY